jgi:hypothetical protein
MWICDAPKSAAEKDDNLHASATTIEEMALYCQLKELSPPTTTSYPIPLNREISETQITHPASLLEKEDATIKMTHAPDGRPFVLSVRRSFDVAKAIESLPFFAVTERHIRSKLTSNETNTGFVLRPSSYLLLQIRQTRNNVAYT